MPLIRDAEMVRSIYDGLSRTSRAMPAFCTENRRTTLAILEAARLVAEKTGKPDLPVVVAFTASYPLRPQLKLYSGTGKLKDGMACLWNDVKALVSSDSPYGKLRVMLHLDHAQPEQDRVVLDTLGEHLASVMWDGSHHPFERNMELTRAFVEEYGKRFLVEGAVDEIPEFGQQDKVEYTTPERAQAFLQYTGVDLIVPNVGTEHRTAATGKAEYRREIALAVKDAVGDRLVLHGSSCLDETGLGTLGKDGFVRLNMWTSLERVGGLAVAKDVLDHLGEILPANERSLYVEKGILASGQLNLADAGSVLNRISETHRRDEVWIPAVCQHIVSFMEILDYARAF